MEFDFSKENFASSTPTLFIFNPTLFELPSSLDRFIDEKREYPIVFSEPFMVADMTTIQFDPQNFAVEGLIEGISKQTPFAGFVCGMAKREDGTLFFKRKYILTKTLLAPTQYDALRKLEKEIAKANYQKVVLKKK